MVLIPSWMCSSMIKSALLVSYWCVNNFWFLNAVCQGSQIWQGGPDEIFPNGSVLVLPLVTYCLLQNFCLNELYILRDSWSEGDIFRMNCLVQPRGLPKSKARFLGLVRFPAMMTSSIKIQGTTYATQLSIVCSNCLKFCAHFSMFSLTAYYFHINFRTC